jgi:chloride channel protein, CIC family
MEEVASELQGPRWSRIGMGAIGGLLGGLCGGFFVVAVTLVLKAGMDFVSAQDTVFILIAPLVGLALAVLLLHGFGRDAEPHAATARPAQPSRSHAFRTFPSNAARADITGDVIDSAGEEERFPWRLAPIRLGAILATVGSGAAMGTEAPAAYLGVAAGACLGERGRWWRRLLRPAAIGGGAAGVAALMAIPLVGSCYLLELGQQRRAPYSAERVSAALVGGLVGWGINATFHLDLIRLVVPREPPLSFAQAAVTAIFIGALSGAITSLAGAAIYKAKKWQAPPAVRLALGGLATFITAVLLVRIAAPAAAVGPGGGAILWAENTPNALPLTLLAVCILRALATTVAAAAGGCGGVFVPFLAIGDIGGRVFAPGLAIGSDLAGAAGAAAGIAGGYRLPLTAIAMIIGIGGPYSAKATCLATVAVAFVAGIAVDASLARASRWFTPAARGAEAH